MGAVLWCGTALLLDQTVEPTMSLDRGQTFVLDPVALAEATSAIVGVAMLSWAPILLFARRTPDVFLVVIATVSTWAFVGIPFALIDKFDVIDVTRFRAAEVMDSGLDLVFLPILIPVIAALSGILYVLAILLAGGFNKASR